MIAQSTFGPEIAVGRPGFKSIHLGGPAARAALASAASGTFVWLDAERSADAFRLWDLDICVEFCPVGADIPPPYGQHPPAMVIGFRIPEDAKLSVLAH